MSAARLEPAASMGLRTAPPQSPRVTMGVGAVAVMVVTGVAGVVGTLMALLAAGAMAAAAATPRMAAGIVV